MEKSDWYKDRQSGAAFLAAPAVWTSLYLIDRPHISILWFFETPWLFLMLVFVRPVLEELVFRGLLQGGLLKQRWTKHDIAGITVANIAVSILFTALHLISHTPSMAVLVFVPSLVFGYFRDRYHGWLVPSIILHCFYNAGYFLMYKPAF